MRTCPNVAMKVLLNLTPLNIFENMDGLKTADRNKIEVWGFETKYLQINI